MYGRCICVCDTGGMSSPEPPGEWPYGQPGRRHATARDLSRAVAERERGRRRLTAATATVSFASVVGAGVVAAVLPGSTHATVYPSTQSGSSASTGTGSSSSADDGSGTANVGSGSQNSGSGPSSGSSSSDSSNSSDSQSNSSNLQAPAYTPAPSSGGGQSTSGGTSPA